MSCANILPFLRPALIMKGASPCEGTGHLFEERMECADGHNHAKILSCIHRLVSPQSLCLSRCPTSQTACPSLCLSRGVHRGGSCAGVPAVAASQRNIAALCKQSWTLMSAVPGVGRPIRAQTSTAHSVRIGPRHACSGGALASRSLPSHQTFHLSHTDATILLLLCPPPVS